MVVPGNTKITILSILHHQLNFGVYGDWNVFATSHGKNACDRIGGTVKRLITNASLQKMSQYHAF